MSEQTTAVATANVVSGLSSGFMLDGATYKRGAQLGFSGIDFYFAGRGGVLGDVCADVVVSAFVFFSPTQVKAAWAGSRDVMSRAAAAEAFADCMGVWAETHLDDSVDWSRLSELAGKVADSATVAAAPLFAAWRNLDEPTGQRRVALHRMNQLRELRMARHGAAIVAVGVDPADAVRHRTPQMLGIFGWDSAEVSPAVAAAWTEAERLTNVASARDYAVLTAAESADFIGLCSAAQAAVS